MGATRPAVSMKLAWTIFLARYGHVALPALVLSLHVMRALVLREQMRQALPVDLLSR